MPKSPSAGEPSVAGPSGFGKGAEEKRSASEILSEVRIGRSPRASPTLMIAGMCAIVAGLLAIIQGFELIWGTSLITSAVGAGGWTVAGALLGFLEIALGILSIQAGSLARRLKRYHRALAGSICGMVALGLVIGAFLGLVAAMLVAVCRDEFPSSRPAAENE